MFRGQRKFLESWLTQSEFSNLKNAVINELYGEPKSPQQSSRDMFETPSRVFLEEAPLKLLELAPLCLSLLRQDVSYYCPTGVGP
jgi:hypothetical protein